MDDPKDQSLLRYPGLVAGLEQFAVAIKPLDGVVVPSVAAASLIDMAAGLAENSRLLTPSLATTGLIDFVSEFHGIVEQLDLIRTKSFALPGLSLLADLRIQPLDTGILDVVRVWAEGLSDAQLTDSDWAPLSSLVEEATDRTMVAWLYACRPDLLLKYEGIEHALEHSIDPVLHGAASATELLSHLFDALRVNDKDVRAWVEKNPRYASEALDLSQSDPRVTWAGRVRFAAVLADLTEGEQEQAASLASVVRRLQRIKHEAHRKTVEDVRDEVAFLQVLLELFAWRLNPPATHAL